MDNSVLLINKPPGMTSHDVVNRIRKRTGIKRVGHAGTLDPFAQGLLIILVGREATRRQQEYLAMEKTYRAGVYLGRSTDTDDRTGKVLMHYTGDPLPLNKISNALSSFRGTFEQMPPAYSAKKICGTPAYRLARRGITPKLTAKKISVSCIEIVAYEWPILTLELTVSSGTYIRSIARDLGAALSCGASLEWLIRTSIGPYTLEQAEIILK